MSTKECADIVFCIDASDSMTPVFGAVKNSITKLLDGLKKDAQHVWDIRVGFLAHASDGSIFRFQSLNHGSDIIDAIYDKKSNSPNGSNSAFFTSNLEAFKSALNSVETQGDEATLIALDVALDFPYRPSNEAHRVVVLLTDEPIETGVCVEESIKQIQKLVEKVHRKRIKLFIIGPESQAFYSLSMADRCEYEVVEASNDGMRSVNFGKLFEAIGKSVSVSQYSKAETDSVEPLFDQDKWGTSSDAMGGERGH